jgi:type I restriction enzyme S subunit
VKKGWEIKRLPDIAEYFIGLTYSPKDVSDVGTIVLRSSNVQNDEIDLSDLVRVTCSVKKPLYVRKGDVLMCSRNGSKRLVGKTAVIGVLPEEMTFGTFMTVIRSELNPYLSWFFRSEAFRDQIGVGENTMINQVTKYMLDAIRVPVPPLAEQQRIVGLLDEAFEGLATAKANAEKNLQNARALFESHLQSVFTQRGPGWVETTLDKISINLDSRRVPITKNVRSSGEYPYYGASGIVDYVADFIFEGDNLLVSEDGANLLARSTPIAFSVSGKYWVNNHAHILHFENMATQRFAEFYLESIKLDDYITGAAQPKLNQKALNSIPIPIPKSVETQARIVESVESLQEATQRLAAIYSRKLAALEALKKSLLHQAFSGGL